MAFPYVGGHIQAQINRELPLRLKFDAFIDVSSLYLVHVLVKLERAWLGAFDL